jgi:hypothetical protein
LAAFTCYFDASGTQHDKAVLVVAGLMSTAEYWTEFETVWRERLTRSGLAYFHRKEMNLRKQPRLIEDLAEITRTYAMRKFGMVVRVDKLHEMVDEVIYKNWALDAYSYAARACAAHARIWAKRNNQQSVPDLVYATGDKGRNQLEQRLRTDGFSGYSFRPAQDQVDRKTGQFMLCAPPLQAADLLAYELYAPTIKLAQGEAINRNSLSEAWFVLDKIPGEPQMSEADDLTSFYEQLQNFTDDSTVRISTWLPPPGAFPERGYSS